MKFIDILIVTSGLAFFFAGGLLFRQKQRNSYEFFAGSRSIPWVLACLSLVATETSGITFLGVPELAFKGNWAFLQMAFGYAIGRVLVAWILVPSVRRNSTTSVYEYLGPASAWLVAFIFIVTRILADGVRLFVTAVPLSLVSGLNLELAILLILAVTTLYSAAGGIRCIVWLDTVQLSVYLLGAGASILIVAGSVENLPQKLNECIALGKFRLIDTSFDLNRYTLWAGIIGGAAFSFASHGVDHLMAQRYLVVRGEGEARKVVVGSGIVILFQFAFFLFLGSMLFCLWPERSFEPNTVYASFISEKLPVGLRGLVLAGVFGAAMSTLSSSLNACAASALRDIGVGLFGLGEAKAKSLRWARAGTVAAALALGLSALAFTKAEKNMVDLAMGVASITYGGILGVFLLKRLTKTESSFSPLSRSIGLALGTLWALYLFFFPLPLVGKVFWPWLVPTAALVTFLSAKAAELVFRISNSPT